MKIAAKVLSPQELLAWTLAVAEGRHLAVIGVVNKVLANGNCNEREAKYIIAFSDALLRRLNN